MVFCYWVGSSLRIIQDCMMQSVLLGKNFSPEQWLQIISIIKAAYETADEGKPIGQKRM